MRRASVSTGLLTLALIGSLPAGAQVLRQVTQVESQRMGEPAISADGTETLAVVNVDPLGANPRDAFQVFAFDNATGTPTQLTHFPEGVQYLLRGVSATSDGTTIAFASVADLTGGNADGSPEIFVMSRDGETITQVTDDPLPNAGSIHSLKLAAGGSRVVFISTSDPLGTNPSRTRQAFLAETDGSGVTQLTSPAGGEVLDADIDGAGEKIVFLQGGVHSILNDGSGLRFVSSSRGRRARISSDGSTLVFGYDPPSSAHNPDLCARIVDWDLVSFGCADGEKPGVSGDGQRMFYPSVHGNSFPNSQSPGDTVYWTGSDGGGVLVPPPPPDPPYYVSYDDISVSGDGTQVSLTRRLDTFVDGSLEHSLDLLTVSVGEAPVALQRLFAAGLPQQSDIAHDGSLIAFLLSEFGGSDGGLYVYAVHPDGTGLRRLGVSPTFDRPLVSPDGQTVYFNDLAIDADGTNLRPFELGANPQISANGAVFVYTAGGQVTVAGPDGSNPTILAGGSNPRIDAAGTWVAYVSQGEVYRVHFSGVLPPEPISPGYIDASSPDISADGTRVAYIANGDQIYLHNTSTGLTKPLTQDLGAEVTDARISPDGGWVYFTADVRLDEDDPDVFHQVFRVSVDSPGALQRWFGLGYGPSPDPRADTFSAFIPYLAPPAVELDGSGRSVFVAAGNLGGNNPGEGAQVWLADPDASNPLRVSGPAPTRLDWEAEPGFLRYDVVRGDLGQLRGGLDLGNVVCLRDDSPVPTTRGSEDLEDPGPGQAFFYVYRGSYGLNLGSGTYGEASSGADRLPLTGDCPLQPDPS